MDYGDTVRLWMNKHQLNMYMQHPPPTEKNTLCSSFLPEDAKRTASRVKRVARKTNQRHRRAERSRKQAAEHKEFIAQRHTEIGQWLESKRKEQQNIDMKRMADSTLSEVRKKMQSTEKMSNLLVTITKLRNIRKQRLLNQGQTVGSSRSEEIFHRTIGELKRFIGPYYKDYQAEEKTLKVMLEDEKHEREREDDERRREIQARLSKKREKQLDQWLFGDQCVPDNLKPFYDYYNKARTNLDAFVHIRRQWDKYVAAPDDPSASFIPRGWIQPPEPTSQVWSAYRVPDS